MEQVNATKTTRKLPCIFCIFMPFDSAVRAGRHNRALLSEGVQMEKTMNHTFRTDYSLADVERAIESGYTPKGATNWKM